MYGIDHKLLALLFSGTLFLQARLAKEWVGTYLAPAAFFPLAWFFFTMVPLVFLFDVPINAWSIGYISLCALAFSLSALAFDWKFALNTNKHSKRDYQPDFGSKFIRRCLYLAAIFSFVFSTWTLIINGWSITEILFDLLATSGQFAATRGNQGMAYGAIGTMGVFCTYLAAVLGSLVVSAQRTRRARVAIFVISLAPSVYTMVTQSSKLIFLVGLCFYVAAGMMANIYKNKLTIFSVQKLWKVIFVALLLVPFVFVSFISRDNAYSGDLGTMVDYLKYALSSYSFGEIYAFSDFFSYYIGMPAASNYKDDFGSLGAYTFASVFDLLGMGKEFPPGLYEETGSFPDVFETNIFTVFRGLILDFGGFGTLVVMFMSGFVANAFFYRMLTNRRSWFASTAYIASIVAVLLGYLISVFMARYMFLNAIAVYIILKIGVRLKKRRQVRRALAASQMVISPEVRSLGSV